MFDKKAQEEITQSMVKAGDCPLNPIQSKESEKRNKSFETIAIKSFAPSAPDLTANKNLYIGGNSMDRVRTHPTATVYIHIVT